MGVKNLWKLLKNCGQEEIPYNKTLAVDTSIWIHQLKRAPESLISYLIAKRILKLIFHGITPIFVFDTGIPLLKKRTIEKRRQESINMMIKDIILDKMCNFCNQKLRDCKHFNLNEELLDNIDEEVFSKIKNHKYNWGELSDSNEFQDEEFFIFQKKIANALNHKSEPTKTATKTKCITYSQINEEESSDINELSYHNELNNFNESSLHSLSKNNKLRKLIEMRSKRRLPLSYDNTTSENYSFSQIENVKKRNKIVELIKKINNDSKKRVQSDYRIYTEFEDLEEDINQFEVRQFEELNIPKTSGFGYLNSCVEKKIKNDENGDNLLELFETSEGSENEFARIPEMPSNSTLKINKESSNSKHKKYLEQSFVLLKEEIKRNIEIARKNISYGFFETDFSANYHFNSSNIKYKPIQKIKDEEKNSYIAEEKLEDKDVSFDSIERKNQFDEEMSFDDYFELFKTSEEQNINQISHSEKIEYPIDKEIYIQKKLTPKKGNEINDVCSLKSDTQRIQEIIKVILKLFNVQHVDSACEADSQCAEMFSQGIIDGVISEDNDILVYGATLYKNFFSKSKEIIKYTIEAINEKLGLGKEDLIRMSYLLGSDYCEGVKGVGIKKALKIKDDLEEYQIREIKNIYKFPRANEFELKKMPKLNKNKIIEYFQRAGLEEDRIQEIEFFVNKILEKTTDFGS